LGGKITSLQLFTFSNKVSRS